MSGVHPAPGTAPASEETARAAERAALDALTELDKLRDRLVGARQAGADRNQVAAIEAALSTATSSADDLLAQAIGARIAADSAAPAPTPTKATAEEPAPAAAAPSSSVDFAAALSNAIGEDGEDLGMSASEPG